MKPILIRVAVLLAALASATGAPAASVPPDDRAQIDSPTHDSPTLDSPTHDSPTHDSPILIAQAGPSPDGQSTDPAAGARRRRGPPPEAIAACEGKTSGATCSFTNRRNEALTGTCMARPAAAPGAQGPAPTAPTDTGVGPLACRPKRTE